MKAKGFFFLLMLFTIACFTWWTIRLELFSRQNAIHQEELYLSSVDKVYNQILWSASPDSSEERPYPVQVGNYHVFIQKDFLKNLKTEHPNLEFTQEGLILDISPKREKLRSYAEDIYQGRIRQFIESSFFLLLLLIGFIWIYRGLNQALRLTQQQTDFLVSITHELKTPISTSRLTFETLNRPGISEEQRRVLCNNGLETTLNQLHLVESLLAASNLEHGNALFNKQKIHLSEWLEEEMERIKRDYGQKINLVPDIGKGIHAELDETGWRLCLQNLISNAYKYGGEAGKIFISLQRNKDKILFQVGDEGPGIDDDDKRNVFKKFYRCGDSMTRRQRGTGLGLYIVAETVRNHNGKVWIEDRAPSGAMFNLLINAI